MNASRIPHVNVIGLSSISVRGPPTKWGQFTSSPPEPEQACHCFGQYSMT